MLRRLALVGVPFVFVPPAFSQTLPQGVRKAALMGGITEYDFPDGLKISKRAKERHKAKVHDPSFIHDSISSTHHIQVPRPAAIPQARLLKQC
jgi:hypothetical protein